MTAAVKTVEDITLPGVDATLHDRQLPSHGGHVNVQVVACRGERTH